MFKDLQDQIDKVRNELYAAFEPQRISLPPLDIDEDSGPLHQGDHRAQPSQTLPPQPSPAKPSPAKPSPAKPVLNQITAPPPPPPPPGIRSKLENRPNILRPIPSKNMAPKNPMQNYVPPPGQIFPHRQSLS